MVEKAKTPAIRFKGFTEAWEQSELGEAFTQTVGYVNPQAEDIELWSLTLEKGLTPKTERYIRDFLVLKEDKYKVVCPNDIVYNPMNMTLGAIGYNDMSKTVAVSGYYITIKPSNSIDGYYIKTWMQLPQSIELYKTHATGSLLEKQRVQYPTFSKINHTVPSLVEQQKIGILFKNLDKLIALYQRKLLKLKNIKKAMLEKMFAKKGRSVPEIRFAGFTDDWEQRELKDIVDVRSGRDYKHLSKGEIPVYGTGGYMISVNEALSYNEDAIGIGRKGTIDKPYILNAPFWTVDTLFYAVPRGKYDLNFVLDIFQNIDWKKKDESTGVPSLSKMAINSIEFRIPSYQEQKTIGSFFNNIDNLIILHQSKLEKLENIKKAFLEKMFV